VRSRTPAPGRTPLRALPRSTTSSKGLVDSPHGPSSSRSTRRSTTCSSVLASTAPVVRTTPVARTTSSGNACTSDRRCSRSRGVVHSTAQDECSAQWCGRSSSPASPRSRRRGAAAKPSATSIATNDLSWRIRAAGAAALTHLLTVVTCSAGTRSVLVSSTTSAPLSCLRTVSPTHRSAAWSRIEPRRRTPALRFGGSPGWSPSPRPPKGPPTDLDHDLHRRRVHAAP